MKALYAELPTIECQRKCAAYCGPIAMTSVEWERIIHRLGYEPKGDIDKSLDCPMLKDGLCTVYHQRPMICRLWGVAEGLECPHGCQPSRLLTRPEAGEFLHRAEVIAGDA